MMVHSDLNDYKGVIFYKSIRPGKFKGDPEVKDIRALTYDPKSQKIYFKLNFDDVYQEIPQCNCSRRSIDISKEVPNLYQRRHSLHSYAQSGVTYRNLKLFCPKMFMIFTIIYHMNDK